MTEVMEEKEDSMIDTMKVQLREYLDKIITQLDLLEVYEDRGRIKKQVGKVRKWITDDRKSPSIAQLYAEIYSQPDNLDIMLHNIGSPFPGEWKKDIWLRIWNNLTYIERWQPPQPAMHRDYNAPPSVGNVTTYVDQYGMNIFDTKLHRKMADAAIVQWEQKHLKRLYRVDVRQSDPVEGYEHGD